MASLARSWQDSTIIGTDLPPKRRLDRTAGGTVVTMKPDGTGRQTPEPNVTAESRDGIAQATDGLADALNGVELVHHEEWDEVHHRIARALGDQLAPSLERIVAIFHEQIAAQIAPIVNEQFASVYRSLNDPSTAVGAAIAEMQRHIADQAAVIGASALSTYRDVLYNVAVDHHGYVTTNMATAAGVPAVEVRKLAARGGLTNVARGLYQVDGIDGGDRAPFAGAVYMVGQDAHLRGDSVLAFHGLGLVNPQRIKVGTSRRVRRNLPHHIQLVHETVANNDLTEYDSVPSATVERAIRDCIGRIMPERLAEATERAADEGLIRRRQVSTLLDEIGAQA